MHVACGVDAKSLWKKNFWKNCHYTLGYIIYGWVISTISDRQQLYKKLS